MLILFFICILQNAKFLFTFHIKLVILVLYLKGFMMKRNIDKIKYIIRHKKAFLMTEKKLLGSNTIRGYFHDIDKLVLLCIGVNPKKVSEIHRKRSRHHEQNGIIRDIKGAIIDWECAAITKPDKPMNARATFNKYYSHVPGIAAALTNMHL